MGNFEIELLDYEISKLTTRNALKTHLNISNVKVIPDEIMASHKLGEIGCQEKRGLWRPIFEEVKENNL